MLLAIGRILLLFMAILLVNPIGVLIPQANSQEVVLRYGTLQLPENFNPMTSPSLIQPLHVVYGILYVSLIEIDQNIQFSPGLAKSWDVSADGKTWTFHLDESAKWSDGVPITSEDVKFTVEYVQKFGGMLESQYSKSIIESVETPTPNVAVMHLVKAKDIRNNMKLGTILPKHTFEQHQDDALVWTNYPNTVSSGPLKLVEYKSGAYIKFQRNPYFWKGQVKIDAVYLQVYPSLETALLALKKGEIDMWPWAMSPVSAQSLKTEPNIEVYTATSADTWQIYINVKKDGKGNPTLRDSQVRLALYHAIDKDYVNQAVNLGMYRIAWSDIVPGLPDEPANLDLPHIKFDLTLANKILDDAGYTKKRADGTRLSPTGVALEYNIWVPHRLPEQLRAAEIIAGSWKQIGVTAKPALMDAGTLWGKCTTWEYDLTLWRLGVLGLDPEYSTLGDFTPDLFGELNIYGYDNPVYTGLWHTLRDTYDPGERKKIIWQLQDILFGENGDFPMIPMYFETNIAAHRTDKFTGWAPYPFWGIGNMYSWWWWTQITPIAVATTTTEGPVTTTPIATSTTTSEPMIPTGYETVIALLVIVIVVALAAIILRRRKKT